MIKRILALLGGALVLGLGATAVGFGVHTAVENGQALADDIKKRFDKPAAPAAPASE